ncbi:hypothetical protein SLNSH_20595 [Alsobacter soli]|uniref:O-antigen ligase domain-containing protein n=1 Tax=Alsobacter soli TaxID=2109933 RepID=A0A2T1HNG5_9HYPH|nr:O-antigen ligase family protein [Alsobacter soli]PSC03131.1 hypothetical protein SLNSH_20595 [Alsobacter soli]
MNPMQPSSLVARVIPPQIHLTLVAILLFAEIVYSSRLHMLFPYLNSQPLVLGLIFAISGIYAALTWIDGFASQIISFLIATSVVAGAVYNSEQVTNLPNKLSTAFQFAPLFTFGVFFALERVALAEATMRMVVISTTIYVCSYLIVVLLFMSELMPALYLRPILLTDVERGDRIFVYAGAAAFAWYYWFGRALQERTLWSMILATFCGVAILLTLSRLFISCVVLMTALFVLRFSTSAIRKIALMILGSSTLLYTFGFIDVSFNPFSAFSADSSGGARAIEYDLARHLLFNSPLLGIGVHQSSYELGFVTGNYFFASADLGPLGVWLDFGALGLCLFFAASYVSCQPIMSIPQRFGWPLFLTGSMLTAYGCIAPNLFSQGGALYFAMIFGFSAARTGTK